MGRPRVDTVAPKLCRQCGAVMERKRINGRLEDNGVFARRQFCNQDCMAGGMIREVVSVYTSRERATKTFRQGSCSSCGVGPNGRNLHVHHIDGNPLNNTQANLSTVCFRCHMAIHRATASSRKSPAKSSRP